MTKDPLSAWTFWIGVVIVPVAMVLGELTAQLRWMSADHIPSFFPREDQPNWLAAGLLAATGIGLVLSWYIRLKSHAWTRDNVFRKLHFLRQTGGAAWGVGAGLSAMATAFFYLLPVGSQHYERFTGILGIYGAIIGSTIAVDALYNRIAPITDLPTLLERMSDDLRKSEAARRLVLVYPALTIGFFRDARGSQEPHEAHPWHDFKDALLNALNRAALTDRQALVVTYPRTLYRQMYEAYAQGALGTKTEQNDERKARVEISVQVSEQLANYAAVANRFFEVPPDSFPEHAIVIGATCYLLPSFGLPIYRGGQFVPTPGERLAHVIAFRRQDATLAEQLRKHIEALALECGKAYEPGKTRPIQPQQEAADEHRPA